MSLSKSILTGKNFISGLLGIAFSVAMLLVTSKASSAYPYAVFTLMLVFSVIVIAQSLRKKYGGAFEKFTLPEILFIVLLVINPLLANVIGFYVSSFIEVFFIYVLISGHDKKNILHALIFSVILIAISYVIFTYGLRIRCPSGMLSLI